MGISVGGPGTKYVRMEIDFWYQEDDGSIHITSPDEGKFHTTVKDGAASVRSHPSLFKHLRRILKGQGRWPAAE